MKEHPDLTASGFGVDEDPNDLLQFIDACNASCEWLSLVQRTKMPNRKIGGSYRLKHVVERWYEKKYGKPQYVPDGAFIAAAYHLGFISIPKHGSPSVFFNISSRTKIDGSYI
jgi:hypothetical protein